MNIRCDSLTVGYEGNIILDKIATDFPAEHVNVIIGPSGSGKSTLLRAIASLEDPLDGKIFYEDKPHNELCPRIIRERVGMIFQRPAIFEGTVYDNLIFGLIQQKREINRNVIEKTVKEFGIPIEYLEKKGSELSVGEQQRICIIRALLLSPELILLDEPTSALDPQTSRRVHNTIRLLKTEFKKNVIMVSHNIKESLDIADRIYYLVKGKIMFSGTKEEMEEYKSTGSRNNEISRFMEGDYD